MSAHADDRGRLQEADLIQPDDFNLLPIQEYPARRLTTLLHAAMFLREQSKDHQLRADLDAWCYVLRDAIEEATRNEVNRKEFSHT
jgi:hypothetical protein